MKLGVKEVKSAKKAASSRVNGGKPARLNHRKRGRPRKRPGRDQGFVIDKKLTALPIDFAHKTMEQMLAYICKEKGELAKYRQLDKQKQMEKTRQALWLKLKAAPPTVDVGV